MKSQRNTETVTATNLFFKIAQLSTKSLSLRFGRFLLSKKFLDVKVAGHVTVANSTAGNK